MVDLVEFSVVDVTKGRMDIQLCGHGDLCRPDGDLEIELGCPQNPQISKMTE